MLVHVYGRKGLVSLIVVMCLLPVRVPGATSSPAEAWQGCGPSMQGMARLRADLALDAALTNRAASLAASLGSGQAPPANEAQTLAEDSWDNLSDAGDQFEQAADEIGKQLKTMNLPRQQRAWGKAIDDMKTARSKIHYPTRQELTAGARSATGVGPRMVTEAAAAAQFGAAADNLIVIKDDGQFNHVARSQGIQNSARDTNPPENPGPDPWQEWLRRLEAQQARIRNSISGLNAARALQGNQVQQAQQHVAQMQKAVQDAQQLANQLGQLVALCNQPSVNQGQQPVSQPPSAPVSSVAPAPTRGGGGSGSGAAKLVIGGAALAGAGVLGLAALNAAVCAEPSQTNYNACFAGSCSACAALLAEQVPYCDCVEAKESSAAGVGSLCRQAADAAREAVRLCRAPTSPPQRSAPAIRK